jgi:hypothetical protein
MKIAGATIKPEWLLYGAAAGLLVLWAFSRKDRNGDGEADGIAGGLGFDAGRVLPDLVTGAADGFLDGLAAPLGGSYSDCERAKASGDKMGIFLACWPKDWGPVFGG